MPLYKAFGLTIHSQLPLPELVSETSSSPIDFEIKINTITLPVLRKTRINRRGIQAFFGKDPEGNLILHWEGVATFRAESGTILSVWPLTDDANLLSLFTVSEAMGLILFQRGYFLLHASAVRVGDEAFCFMGNPGAGKSTTAAALVQAGGTLLSDDLTAITFDDKGNCFVVPAYPQLKIWDNTVNGLSYDRSKLQPVSEGVNKFSFKPEDFSQEKVRLKEVYFIHKANNQSVKRLLKAPEIPLEMLKNFPLSIALLKNQALKTHFLQSFQCAAAAQIWKMRRPAGFDNLRAWAKEIVTTKTEILDAAP